MTAEDLGGGSPLIGTGTAGVLAERDAERAVLDQLVLGVLSGRSGVVTVECAPGLGRSALLAAAAALAEAVGLPVGYARCDPAGERRPLEVPARLLATLVPDQPLLPGMGLRTLTPDGDHGLVLVVDDAQAADPDSVRWLERVVADLADRPAALMLGVDTVAPPVVGPGFAARRPAGVAGHTLTPRPLTAAGVRAVLTEVLGEDPGEPLVAEAAARTGGNPAVLCATLQRLAYAEVTVERLRDTAARVRREHLFRILDRLPEPWAAALRALAASGRDRDPDEVLALWGPDMPAAGHALAALREAGLLMERHGRLTVAEPVADRLLSGLTAEERGRLFADAARTAHLAGEPPAVIARPLLHAAPIGEPWVPEVLRAAGREAPGPEGVAALRRALREPLDDRRRAELVLELASAETATADRAATPTAATAAHAKAGALTGTFTGAAADVGTDTTRTAGPSRATAGPAAGTVPTADASGAMTSTAADTGTGTEAVAASRVAGAGATTGTVAGVGTDAAWTEGASGATTGAAAGSGADVEAVAASRVSGAGASGATAADRRLTALVVVGAGEWGQRVAAADLILCRGDARRALHAVAAGLARPDVPDAEREDLIGLRMLAEDCLLVPDEPGVRTPPPRAAPANAAQAGAAAWRQALRGVRRDLVRTLARAALTRGEGGPFAPRLAAARALALAGEDVEATAWLDELLTEIRRAGARAAAGAAHVIRAELMVGRGLLAQAAHDLHLAFAEVPAAGWHAETLARVLAIQALLDAQGGRRDRAGLVPGEPAGLDPAGVGRTYLLFGQGMWASLSSQFGTAAQLFLECGRRKNAAQWANPALLPWRPYLAETLDVLGRREEALRLLAENLALAETWGAPGPIGLTHLFAGRLLRGAERVERLSLAVEALRASPDRLRLAQALLALAEVRMAADAGRGSGRASGGDSGVSGGDAGRESGGDAAALLREAIALVAEHEWDHLMARVREISRRKARGARDQIDRGRTGAAGTRG